MKRLFSVLLGIALLCSTTACSNPSVRPSNHRNYNNSEKDPGHSQKLDEVPDSADMVSDDYGHDYDENSDDSYTETPDGSYEGYDDYGYGEYYNDDFFDYGDGYDDCDDGYSSNQCLDCGKTIDSDRLYCDDCLGF